MSLLLHVGTILVAGPKSSQKFKMTLSFIKKLGMEENTEPSRLKMRGTSFTIASKGQILLYKKRSRIRYTIIILADYKMQVDYLLHQTSLRNLESILTRGLKPSLKWSRIVEEYGDLERFVWFDFIGQKEDKIIYSSTGSETSGSKGITIVFDFRKVLAKVKRQGGQLSLKFLSDYVRFEPETHRITLWDSHDDKPLPPSVSNAVECVISTDEIDKTLNSHLSVSAKSDKEQVYIKLTNCISKIVVCKELVADLNRTLRMLGFKIPVIVHRGLSKSEMKTILESHCPKHSKEVCEMLHVETFIANCTS